MEYIGEKSTLPVFREIIATKVNYNTSHSHYPNCKYNKGRTLEMSADTRDDGSVVSLSLST